MLATPYNQYLNDIILIACVCCLLIGSKPVVSAQLSQPDTKIRRTDSPQATRALIHLYFADPKNFFLIAENRLIFQRDDPAEFGKSILRALIQGPQGELVRTIPPETALRALYVTQAGICYVDLTMAVKEKHPGGSQTELLTLYSIVNSLILNVPEIQRVKILINGEEAQTLAGHVDLQYPLKANMLLIR